MNNLTNKFPLSKILLLGTISLSTMPITAIGEPHGESANSIAVESITRSYVQSNRGQEAAFSEFGIAKSESKSVGLELVVAEDTEIYSVPLSYGVPMGLLGGEEFLNISMDLPYISTETSVGDESGIGDIAVAAEYYIERESTILKAQINYKMPTGDEEKGLGSGSNDVGFGVTGRKRVGQFGFNSTVGYIIRGEAEINNIDIEYGNIVSLLAGTEYRLQPTIWLGVNLAYVREGTSDHSGFEENGLQTLDVIPNVTYQFNEKINVTADLIYPLQESEVKGDFSMPEPDREISISVGFNSEF